MGREGYPISKEGRLKFGKPLEKVDLGGNRSYFEKLHNLMKNIAEKV